MKRFILAGLLTVTISASLLGEQGVQFQTFKLNHAKTYKNQAEETKRFAIFKDNMEKIATHNARFEQGLETYRLAMNRFADITAKEFTALLAAQIASGPNLTITETFNLPEGVQAPSSIDWRQKNVVTPVKNQGLCGSAWAFALIGSIEAANALKTGELVPLSMQQLIDCATATNNGCSGGLLESIIPYILKYGLESEDSYPSTGADSSCKYETSKVAVHVDSFVTINKDEQELKNAVGTLGPVSITINADYLQFYESGIFHNDDCSKYTVNHAALIVGYDSESGVDYWILKNSWGINWGENGYFRFKLGVNECRMSENAIYPVIKQFRKLKC